MGPGNRPETLIPQTQRDPSAGQPQLEVHQLFWQCPKFKKIACRIRNRSAAIESLLCPGMYLNNVPTRRGAILVALKIALSTPPADGVPFVVGGGDLAASALPTACTKKKNATVR